MVELVFLLNITADTVSNNPLFSILMKNRFGKHNTIYLTSIMLKNATV